MGLIKCLKCGCQNAISFSKCTKCNALLIYNVEKPVISNPAINKPATNRKHNAKKPKQNKFFNIDSVVLSILIIGSVILYILSKYDWKWAFLHLVWLLGLIIYSIIIIFTFGLSYNNIIKKSDFFKFVFIYINIIHLKFVIKNILFIE